MVNKQRGPFYSQLEERVSKLGGLFNAHLHLDRACTLDDRYMAGSQHQILLNSHISLHEKHSLIDWLHAGPAYEEADLRRRVNECLDMMIAVGTRRADTMVDVTADRVKLSALEILGDVKRERAGEIDLRLAAYSPSGFTDEKPERWDVFEAAVARADFIGALPEADDVVDYPDHIGFSRHCEQVLALARQHGKAVHVHTDQRNEPSESGTERLIDAVREFGAPESETGEPMIWAVHMISPSTYDEARFDSFVEGLIECNIGVICCPSAAIGMRQLRPIQTPTYNSIPRVLELLAAGVHVRLASDNIADICSPSTTGDLIDEVFVLSAALRFYHVGILAKLAAGQALDDNDRQVVQEHLEKDAGEVQKLLSELDARSL
jgi:cytosine/adenosine deaminase-related metal-dependent hydrolase